MIPRENTRRCPFRFFPSLTNIARLECALRDDKYAEMITMKGYVSKIIRYKRYFLIKHWTMDPPIHFKFSNL